MNKQKKQLVVAIGLLCSLGAQAAEVEDTVIVSARKREERLEQVPLSVNLIGAKDIERYQLLGVQDYAAWIPNLSYAYGNGATAGNPATAFGDALTLAIRGVAGARTTALYLDEVPLPASLDVRLLDVQRIEVLKGPQGSLFGESSLGGAVRLMSTPVRMNQSSARAEAGVGSGSALSTRWQLNNGAFRWSGLISSEPGFLSRKVGTQTIGNQGAERMRGSTLQWLFKPDRDIDIQLRWLWQSRHLNGFPAGYAPLPAFEVQSTLDRSADVQPFVHDVWSLPSASLTWRGDGWRYIGTVSRFTRSLSDREDSTEGTAQYWGTTLPQAFAWDATHSAHQWTHESRLQWGGNGPWSGTVGVYQSQMRADFEILPIYGQLGKTPGTPSLLWEQTDHNVQRNRALFGELEWEFLPGWRANAGLRQYWQRQNDELRFAILSTKVSHADENASQGRSPKLGFSWQWRPDRIVYASAAKGFRQGNVQLDVTGFGCDVSLKALGQTPASIAKIRPDHISNHEVGVRGSDADGHWSAAVFNMQWDDIQQPLFLASCGFYVQGNAGAARLRGAEWEWQGKLMPGLDARFAAGYVDARITKQGGTGQAPGSRVFQVPRTNLAAALWHEQPWMDGVLALGGQWTHTGDSLSANSDANLALVRKAYSLVSLHAVWRSGPNQLGVQVKNLTDARPNLGDIGYIGYQRYVPGTTTPLPQAVTLPPRTWHITYRRDF